jgi:hypothetical protein
LNIKTRGIIEKSFDASLEQDILEVVDWIFKETSVKSREDLILGYVLGSCMRYASDTLEEEKRYKRIDKEVEKILGKKRVLELQLKRKAEEVKPIRVSLTQKEKNQLRDMLIQRIPSYRRKIYRELNK